MESPLAVFIPGDRGAAKPPEESVPPEAGGAAEEKWQLQKLTPRHRQAAALIAQGTPYVKVAAIVSMTPEYISMLMKQPLMKAYVMELCEIAGTKLEALFEKSVDVISEVLTSGSNADKLKAARLQLEATHRIGRPDPVGKGGPDDVDRLERLAERLLGLQSKVRKGGVFNENGEDITDA